MRLVIRRTQAGETFFLMFPSKIPLIEFHRSRLVPRATRFMSVDAASPTSAARLTAAVQKASFFFYCFNGISTSSSTPLSAVTMTLLIACTRGIILSPDKSKENLTCRDKLIFRRIVTQRGFFSRPSPNSQTWSLSPHILIYHENNRFFKNF